MTDWIRTFSLALSFVLCASLAACSSDEGGSGEASDVSGIADGDAGAEGRSVDTSTRDASADSESPDEPKDADAATPPEEPTDTSGQGPIEGAGDAADEVLDTPESSSDADVMAEDIAPSGPADDTSPAGTDDGQAEPSDSEDTDAPEEDVSGGDIACLFGGLPCPDGHYCDTGGCGLGLEGVCVAKPSTCEPSDQSVCACDGNTYASACFAKQAGQRAIGPGPCPAVALNCTVDTSGFGFGTGCDVNEYCFGGCVGEGFCKERPICGNAPGDVQCACNGLDYATPCTLASAGKNLDFVGWCGEQPEICGGPDQLVCEDPEAICDLQSCNVEAEGLCLTDLQCPPGSPPECGCDNVTYASKCARVAAEVAFKHMGDEGGRPRGDLVALDPPALFSALGV